MFRTLEEILQKLVEILREKFGNGLCIVALSGSVARKSATHASDIDILVVSRATDFRSLWREARRHWEKKYLKILKEQNMPTFLSPIFLDEAELKDNPLILLNIIDDGIILFDEGDILEQRLQLMRERLREVGAKKIYLEGDKWYWDLKPNWRPGERFSL